MWWCLKTLTCSTKSCALVVKQWVNMQVLGYISHLIALKCFMNLRATLDSFPKQRWNRIVRDFRLTEMIN